MSHESTPAVAGHVLYRRSQLAASPARPGPRLYQIHPFSRASRYASARDPASSFWVIVAR